MYFITTFYKFIAIADLAATQKKLEDAALAHQIMGLVILGHEGLNLTVSAENEAALANYKQFLTDELSLVAPMFKDSHSPKKPFRRFKVKIREEIVTLGSPDLKPDGQNHHLSPTEWHKVLTEEKDFLLIDTRNWYETRIGTFKNAIDPLTKEFKDFPQFIEKQDYPKDKKMLIFCTGGIRCEKGILELQRQGFNNVHQLEGGILKYIEEYPNGEFEGECFVFDHRVALDQELQPTKVYGLCPHCGQPAKVDVTCKRCDTKVMICDPCLEKEWVKDTCSKHCEYQLALHPDRKGPPQHMAQPKY